MPNPPATSPASPLNFLKVYLAAGCSEGCGQPQPCLEEDKERPQCVTCFQLPGDVAGGEINGYFSALHFRVGTG